MSVKVIAFGEALIDMLAKPGQAGPASFVAHPGGAPANVAVGVAKLGGNASFLGQVGQDMFGDTLVQTMQQFGVDTSQFVQTAAAMTALAFVSLDAEGERSFAFYRDRSADLLYRAEQCPQDFLQDALFHSCSNTLTEAAIREQHLVLMQRAHDSGAVVSFDVNYRHNLWAEGVDAREPIWQAMLASDLVKISREELEALYGKDPSLVAKLLDGGVTLLLITDGGEPMEAHWAGGSLRLNPPATQVLDSTAAGDSFVAGLLYQLSTQSVGAAKFGDWVREETSLRSALEFASRCGALTVSRYGAFEALPVGSELGL
ncbi:carbohydrate kinase family protein [Marinobacterium rhizophilum]|uniref:Carbohydrate kinase n=1 Tax=Marinobacterium rhizophilum TaxID=420402 RepID=A0ABY5HKM4_9GAMM|nr:carbohydrate kinase [Marinobacterium rhizophilum]UTW12850.1 carbohydrate kinase [Marinobacterium rhizophilum]